MFPPYMKTFPLYRLAIIHSVSVDWKYVCVCTYVVWKARTSMLIRCDPMPSGELAWITHAENITASPIFNSIGTRPSLLLVTGRIWPSRLDTVTDFPNEMNDVYSPRLTATVYARGLMGCLHSGRSQ